MKRVFLVLALLGLMTPMAFSQSVKESDVRKVFGTWLSKSARFKKKTAPFFQEAYQIKTVQKLKLEKGAMPLYAIELDPEGFVIMNSDKRLPPIIAYSESGSLNLDDLPQNAFRGLLKKSMKHSYKKMLNISTKADALDVFQALDEAENLLQWEQLLEPEEGVFPLYSATSADIGPFLTTTWNQNNHYNELCPLDATASSYYDGHAAVGCVAVVGAQIMNFYEWPYRGTGGHSYTDSEGSITGAHSVVFSDSYDWANMQDSYDPWGSEPSVAVDAVSELMYEMGVAVEMDYATNGSWASMYDLKEMMNSALFYEEGTYLYDTSNTQNIADQLQPELLAGRPAVLSIPGHAMVADGYRDEGLGEFFHVNYGWGSSNDGWYLIDGIPNGVGDGCITGLYPAMVPVNVTESGTTNDSTAVDLAWDIANVRTAEVQSVSVLSHVLQSSTFTDPAEDFLNFAITSTTEYMDWDISTAGYSGDCFYKEKAGYNNREYHLTSIEKFVPESGAQLSFQLKTRLGNSVFRVMVSDDDGQSWSLEYSLTDYYGSLSWELKTVDLSSYAGSEILIRFEYVVGDSYYTIDGVWLDSIEFSGGSWYDWEIIDTSSSLTGETVSLPVGTNTLALQAYDGNAWGPRSSSFDVIVLSSGIDDIDSDGLPDDWELLYFGGETNANPSAIASNGLNTVLQAYIAGLNPTNSDSFFNTALTNGYVVQWNTTSGRVYSVWSTTNLLDGFQTLETSVPWPRWSWTDSVERAGNYYRVDVTLP